MAPAKKKAEFHKQCVDLIVRIGDGPAIGRGRIRLAKLFSMEEGVLLPDTEAIMTTVALTGVAFGRNTTTTSGSDAAHAHAEISASRHTIGLEDDGVELGLDEDILLMLCESAAEEGRPFRIIVMVAPSASEDNPAPAATVKPPPPHDNPGEAPPPITPYRNIVRGPQDRHGFREGDSRFTGELPDGSFVPGWDPDGKTSARPTPIPTKAKGTTNFTPHQQPRHQSYPAYTSPTATATSPMARPHPPTERMNSRQQRIWGWRSSATLNPVMNRKELLKINSVKLTDAEDFYSWYMRLQRHAMNNGVYVPALAEVELNNVMGSGWSAMAYVYAIQETMSSHLYSLLIHDDVIDKTLSHLRSAVRDAAGEGYAALYNICRAAAHPNLVEDDDVATEVPKQRNGETFSKYKQRLENYLTSEEIRGRHFTDSQVINLYKSNLVGLYRLKFTENIRQVYAPKSGMPVPYKLHFSQITITCEQWANELGLPLPGKSKRDGVCAIKSHHDDTDTSDPDSDDDVFAVDGPSCPHCGGPHAANDCDPIVNFVLISQLLEKDPALRKEIIRLHGGTKLRRGRRRHLSVRPRRSHDDRTRQSRRNRDRVNKVNESTSQEEITPSTPAALSSTVTTPSEHMSTPTTMEPEATISAVDTTDDEESAWSDDVGTTSGESEDYGDDFDDMLAITMDPSTSRETACEIFDVGEIESSDDDDEASPTSSKKPPTDTMGPSRFSILARPPMKMPEYTPIVGRGCPLHTIFEYKRHRRVRRTDNRPCYRLTRPPPSSWMMEELDAWEGTEEVRMVDEMAMTNGTGWQATNDSMAIAVTGLGKADSGGTGRQVTRDQMATLAAQSAIASGDRKIYRQMMGTPGMVSVTDSRLLETFAAPECGNEDTTRGRLNW